MKTKIEFYNKVYLIQDSEELSDEQMNRLLMCGDSNWDYYFHSLADESLEDVEEIEKVELVEFDSEKDMFSFLKKLSPIELLDYSTNHNKPCVLKFA